MERVKLGSREGIAGEYNLESLNDVMGIKPHDNRWEGVAGTSRDYLGVSAILVSGDQVPLKEAWEQAHACNNDPTTGEDAPVIGEQISGLEVTALIFTRRSFGVNTSYDQEDDYQAILYLTPPDWGKIRRRAEDALRKASPEIIFRVAVELGVKIY